MPIYSCKLVFESLNEICSKFKRTEKLKVKKVKWLLEGRKYQVTLKNGTIHLIDQQLIKDYIESFGENGGLTIAGHLMHDISLEESTQKTKQPEIDEYWEGSMEDVYDYLEKRNTNEKNNKK